jgi:hypothetical protein
MQGHMRTSIGRRGGRGHAHAVAPLPSIPVAPSWASVSMGLHGSCGSSQSPKDLGLSVGQCFRSWVPGQILCLEATSCLMQCDLEQVYKFLVLQWRQWAVGSGRRWS